MNLNLENSKALVSVIIPTYNRLNYLKEALTSAVQQTYQNIEIIVSDNYSDENPENLIKSFQDERIIFVRHETNIGMFANIINGFKLARGKYVASLLDDDIWERNFLENLVPPLEHNLDVALAFCDHYIINTKGQINDYMTQQTSLFYKRTVLKEGIYKPFSKLGIVDQAIPMLMAAVFRRDIVNWDNIPSDVGTSLDLYLSYVCSRFGLGAYYYPEKLTRVRQHDQSDTMLCGKKNNQAKILKGKGQIFCYESFLKDKELQEYHSYFKQKWVEANTTIGIGLMRNKQIKEARNYFWQALGQNLNLRCLTALLLSYTSASFASRF